MVVFWMVYLLPCLVLSVVLYVCAAWDLLIAKNRGQASLVSWIPVADSYLLGCVSDITSMWSREEKVQAKIMLVLSIVLCALYVGVLCQLCRNVFQRLSPGVLHSHAMETILPVILR